MRVSTNCVQHRSACINKLCSTPYNVNTKVRQSTKCSLQQSTTTVIYINSSWYQFIGGTLMHAYSFWLSTPTVYLEIIVWKENLSIRYTTSFTQYVALKYNVLNTMGWTFSYNNTHVCLIVGRHTIRFKDDQCRLDSISCVINTSTQKWEYNSKSLLSTSTFILTRLIAAVGQLVCYLMILVIYQFTQSRLLYIILLHGKGKR